jgi:hypothetical protein
MHPFRAYALAHEAKKRLEQQDRKYSSTWRTYYDLCERLKKDVLVTNNEFREKHDYSNMPSRSSDGDAT